MADLSFDLDRTTVFVRRGDALYLAALLREEFSGQGRATAANATAERIEAAAHSNALDETFRFTREEARLASIALDAVRLARPFMLSTALRALAEELHGG